MASSTVSIFLNSAAASASESFNPSFDDPLMNSGRDTRLHVNTREQSILRIMVSVDIAEHLEDTIVVKRVAQELKVIGK